MTVIHAQSIDLGRLRQIIAGLSEGVILVGADQTIVGEQCRLCMHGAGQATDLGATVDAYRKQYQLRYRNNHRRKKGDYPFDRIIAGEAFSEVVVEVIPAGEESPAGSIRSAASSLPTKRG